MGKVFLDISLSLDGFVAGANITPQNPLGDNGERLHKWIFEDKTEVDAQILADMQNRAGAVVLGNRTYADAIDGAWNGVTPFHVPAFVLATTAPEQVVEGFTFVTDGIESAVKQAKATAGNKDVWVMGGANTAQQFLKAGLLDEIHLHLIPVLLGAGTRLFDQTGTEPVELVSMGVVESAGSTHLKYRVV